MVYNRLGYRVRGGKGRDYVRAVLLCICYASFYPNQRRRYQDVHQARASQALRSSAFRQTNTIEAIVSRSYHHRLLKGSPRILSRRSISDRDYRLTVSKSSLPASFRNQEGENGCARGDSVRH